MFGPAQEVAALTNCSASRRLMAIKRILPKADVARALHCCGKDRTYCKLMPGWLVVWFVVGLGLFHADNYRQVYRRLMKNWPAPERPTLCEARQRVGARPLAMLCKSVIRLLADLTTPGAFYAGLRLMALDAFTLDVFDSPANDRAFGRPGSGRGRSAFPQVRVGSLCEAGTHVFWKSLVRKYAIGECSIAPHLLRQLQAGMLLLWDKGFFKYDHVKLVLEQKAQLLALVKNSLILRPIQRLADGSYLARIYRNARDRRHDQNGIVVRVIQYTLDEPGRRGHGEKHRILTTLLDCVAHPAATLVELYHVRWEMELAIDELKTHQMHRPLLKSQTPAGVIQEVQGILLAHFVVRWLMFQAAAKQSISPLRLSFTGTLNIIECRMPLYPKSPAAQRQWLENLIDEISLEKLPPRNHRINPRVIKRKMSKWKKKRPEHRPYPQPLRTFSQSIVILR